MTSYPVDSFGLIRRQAALRVGFTDNQLTDAVRRGDLIRLSPGIAVERSDRFDGFDGAQRLHRLRAIAVVTSELTGGRPHPISHVSAAALHGLPLLKPDLRRVHVTTGRSSGGSLRAHRHLHAAPLSEAEVVSIDGPRSPGSNGRLWTWRPPAHSRRR